MKILIKIFVVNIIVAIFLIFGYFYFSTNTNRLENTNEGYNYQLGPHSSNDVGWTYHQGTPNGRNNGVNNEAQNQDHMIINHGNETSRHFNGTYGGSSVATSPTSPNFPNNQVAISYAMLLFFIIVYSPCNPRDTFNPHHCNFSNMHSNSNISHHQHLELHHPVIRLLDWSHRNHILMP